MKKILASLFLLLSVNFAMAFEPTLNVGGGLSTGSVFSGSTTDSSSHTGTNGNGAGFHSTMTGATNSSSLTLGGHFGSGKTTLNTETVTQGETLSKSEGWQSGSGRSFGHGNAIQNGGAFASGNAGSAFVGGSFGGFGKFK